MPHATWIVVRSLPSAPVPMIPAAHPYGQAAAGYRYVALNGRARFAIMTGSFRDKMVPFCAPERYLPPDPKTGKSQKFLPAPAWPANRGDSNTCRRGRLDAFPKFSRKVPLGARQNGSALQRVGGPRTVRVEDQEESEHPTSNAQRSTFNVWRSVAPKTQRSR